MRQKQKPIMQLYASKQGLFVVTNKIQNTEAENIQF